MKIGRFKAEEDGGYTGQLDALGFSVSAMTFCPVEEKQADGPDFFIIGYGEMPDWSIDDPPPFTNPVINPNSYDVGAAWKKIGKNGKPYLSVKLDGPTLPAPIHCRLIERKDGFFSLIWKRKDDAEPAAEQRQAAA